MAKQMILPFFIPMEGCPYQCIYCDQVAISGEENSPTAEQIAAAIADFPGSVDAEIAFYGGSFTCLPRERQLYYLQAAAAALRENKAAGIRISTRPDAVDEETCLFLRGQGVTTIELGIQSFDEEVLAQSGRAYTPSQVEQACLAVVKAGLRLGVQLMTGLPADNVQKSRSSVRQSAALGAELLRIYPTLVLKNTLLEGLFLANSYQPQSLEQAVSCCCEMLIEAHAHDLTVIRIGVNPAPQLEQALVAGPYHAAFGALVKEALKKAQLEQLLADYDASQSGILLFPRGDMPLIWGQKRQGLLALGADFPSLALMPDNQLERGMLVLQAEGKILTLSERDFCRQKSAEWAEQ